jgi:hypothetical protein
METNRPAQGASHTFTVPSALLEMIRRPSGVKATLKTTSE